MDGPMAQVNRDHLQRISMTKLSLCAIGAALLFSAGAFSARADDAPGVAQVAPSAAPVDPVVQSNAYKEAHASNKVICKTTDVTGSRLGGERKCMTRAQWDDQAHDSQANVNDFMRGTMTNDGPSGH
jgi:hypothetical protein